MSSFEPGTRGDPPSRDADPFEDGVDPRTYFDRHDTNRPRERKTRMLCAQVADCLQLALDGIGDDDLQDVWLHGVEPFPDAGTLRVTVIAADAVRADLANAALARAAGFLRSEIAAAISRKRVPQLVFRVVAEGAS
jgi:ribosome-binding factor A